MVACIQRKRQRRLGVGETLSTDSVENSRKKSKISTTPAQVLVSFIDDFFSPYFLTIRNLLK